MHNSRPGQMSSTHAKFDALTFIPDDNRESEESEAPGLLLYKQRASHIWGIGGSLMCKIDCKQQYVFGLKRLSDVVSRFPSPKSGQIVSGHDKVDPRKFPATARY